MAEYTALAPLFTDIANAIRSKTGETGAITANSFPAKINEIELGLPKVSTAYKYTHDNTARSLPYTNTKNITIEENIEILINCIFYASNGPNGNYKYTLVTYKCLPNFTMTNEEYTITT